MKILISDDSNILRKNLIRLLSPVKQIKSIMEADSIQSTIELIQDYKPDIMILDINFPEGSGFEVLKFSKEDVWVPLVIMLTNYSDEKFKKKSVRDGANYFFDKSTEFEKIVDVIQSEAERFN